MRNRAVKINAWKHELPECHDVQCQLKRLEWHIISDEQRALDRKDPEESVIEKLRE